MLRYLFLSGFLFIQGALGSEPLTILQRAEGLPQTPPYMWKNFCTGKIEGAIPHLIDHLAGILSRSVIWVSSPEPVSRSYQESNLARTSALESGAVDLVISSNNEFPPPDWITSEAAISTVMIEAQVIADISELTPASLNSLRGGMSASDNPYFQQLRERFQGLRAIDKYNKIIQMLADKELDYIIVGKYQGNLIKRDFKRPLKRIDLMSQTIHLAAKRNPEKEELMMKIDLALNGLGRKRPRFRTSPAALI